MPCGVLIVPVYMAHTSMITVALEIRMALFVYAMSSPVVALLTATTFGADVLSAWIWRWHACCNISRRCCAERAVRKLCRFACRVGMWPDVQHLVPRQKISQLEAQGWVARRDLTDFLASSGMFRERMSPASPSGAPSINHTINVFPTCWPEARRH